jgi:hypothetical protein
VQQESLGGTGETVATVAAVVAALWVALIVWAVRQERACRTAQLAAVAEPVAA